MPPSGGPERAGEGSADESDDSAESGIGRRRQPAKKSMAAVCLRFSHACPNGAPGQKSHSKADEYIAPAMIVLLDGDAHDSRPREGLRAGALREHEIAIGDALQRPTDLLGCARFRCV